MNKKPAMLVVDDMEVNRMLIQRAFCDNYEILQAQDGEEALDLMHVWKDKLSVVLLDIVMPNMDGLTMLEKVQKDEELREIPVIVITADRDEDNEIKALDLGAVDMLKKPYDMRVMQKRISNAVVRREMLRIKEQNMQLKMRVDIDERYRIMQEQTNTILLETNSNLHVKYLSDSISTQIKGDYQEFANLFWKWDEENLIYEEDRKGFKKFLKNIAVAKKGTTKIHTLRFCTVKEEWEWYKMVATVVEGQKSGNDRIVVTLNNVNDEILALEKIRYQAKFDALTKLYNKNTFYHETRKILKKHPKESYALIRMDIERFKVINDLFGMDKGDELLQYMADVIHSTCKGQGVYGRLESDNFAICIPYRGEVTLAEIWNRVGKSVMAFPLRFEMVLDMGVYIITEPNLSIDLMCDRAKLALDTIKGNYLKNYVVYDEILRDSILQEQVIVNEMDGALSQEQFQVYVQPKYDLDTSKPVGAEALVRWMHPGKGMISPGIFISIFEKNGFISRLDHYVWEKTCQFLKECIDENLNVQPISVNVSRIDLYNPRLAEDLEELVKQYELSPSLLELEITESAYMENPEQLLIAMGELQKKGFVILMDDFGSGYSSLNMLKNVPVDVLKVDMEFLRGEDNAGKGRKILKSIVNMSKDVDLPTIIEGVETEEQVEFLKDIGCTQVQGYFYARPMPLSEYRKLLME